ncbi:MAG: RNA methyltransferase [Planctomycetaceae bacterium]|nr:RNA methyltransferase [Planctomycetaceae bacterium]
MPLYTIDDAGDGRLDVFRSLKKTNQTRNTNLFIAEGPTVVERLIAGGFRVHSLLVTPDRAANLAAQVAADVPIYVAERDLASQLVGYKFHLGVIAAAYRRPDLQLADVLPTDGPCLVLFGDQVADPENTGALIRIGCAFGADAVIFGPGCADTFSRRVIRVSTGHVFRQPVVETSDSVACLQELTRRGVTCCATVIDETAEDLCNFAFPRRTALVFGNERHGLGREIQECCRHRLTIRMRNGADSLNLAVAAGVFAYQSLFQNAAFSDRTDHSH